MTCTNRQTRDTYPDDPPRVLIYGAPDSRGTAAAIIANAPGVLRRQGGPEELGEVVTRVVAGEKLYPPPPPDDFQELLDCIDGRDRAIVAKLLERIPPNYVASTLGLSARSLPNRLKRGSRPRADHALVGDGDLSPFQTRRPGMNIRS